LEPAQIGTDRHVQAHDLAPGVHAGVGPPGACELHRVAEHPLDGFREDAGNGRHAPLEGEAVKGSAQVGNEQAGSAPERLLLAAFQMSREP
jgi:hypothetical protein